MACGSAGAKRPGGFVPGQGVPQAPPKKVPKAAALIMVRKDDAVLPTPPTKIQEVAAVAPSSTSVQVGPQAVVPCACLGKSPRRWKSVDEVFGWPIGVYAFKTSAKTVVRYHALFAAVPRRQELIGCFATKEEAAVAWDTEARGRGWTVLNSASSPGCISARVHLRAKLASSEMAGFPYAPVDAGWRQAELQKLLTCSGEEVIRATWATSQEGKLGAQQAAHSTAPGNQLCWSWQSHVAEVKKRLKSGESGNSAMDTYKDRVLLAKCVRSSVEYGADPEVSRLTLNGELHFLRGSWILNFQPLVAAAIYRRYGAGDGSVPWPTSDKRITVYDSSAGWGGRMLGALLSPVVCKYITCEPSTKTFAGLQQMLDFIDSHTVRAPEDFEVELHCCGSEAFELPAESVDFALTSPPYFSLELYSDEPTQSHVKFPRFRSWVVGFLRPTLANTFRGLKAGSFCLINIADNQMQRDQGIYLEQATMTTATEQGFVHESTLRLLKADGSAEKWEPIFVFRKC